MSVKFISLVTSCVGLLGEEPQTAHLMSFTYNVLYISHIAARMLTAYYTLPNDQSQYNIVVGHITWVFHREGKLGSNGMGGMNVRNC